MVAVESKVRRSLFRKTGDERHASGAVVHWRMHDPTRIRPGRNSSTHVGFTCKNAGKVKGCMRLDYTGRGNAHRENWAGLCSKCNPFMRTGVTTHRSGATVAWDERHPDDSQLVAFTCRTCRGGSQQGDERFASVLDVRRDNWTGDCRRCFKRVAARKNTEDETLDSGTKVLWSERDDARKTVPVVCGLVACGKRRDVLPSMVVNWKKRSASGYCPGHTRNELALLARAAVNGGGEKRGRGRTAGEEVLDPELLKADFVAVVQVLRGSLRRDKITRAAITAEYHRRGERLDPSSVTKRVQRIYGENVSVSDAVALVCEGAKV
jgi:hypothetical protein